MTGRRLPLNLSWADPPSSNNLLHVAQKTKGPPKDSSSGVDKYNDESAYQFASSCLGVRVPPRRMHVHVCCVWFAATRKTWRIRHLGDDAQHSQKATTRSRAGRGKKNTSPRPARPSLNSSKCKMDSRSSGLQRRRCTNLEILWVCVRCAARVGFGSERVLDHDVSDGE